jgi:hypothetical protein
LNDATVGVGMSPPTAAAAGVSPPPPPPHPARSEQAIADAAKMRVFLLNSIK